MRARLEVSDFFFAARNSPVYCHFSLRCEMTLLTVRKVDVEMPPSSLIRVFAPQKLGHLLPAHASEF